MWMRPVLWGSLLLLAGCGAAPVAERGPPELRFAPIILPRGVERSNLDLAEDFLELAFQLETGERLPGLLRYEDPVLIYLDRATVPQLAPDLEALIARLRTEAGLDVAETRDPRAAQISIEGVTAAQISRIFPTAACFIVPGETNWRSFQRKRAEEHLRWGDQATLERAAIFLPTDTTPQDLRDCLHEELTQALGPANDLYRLPDSIWNDDNFHGAATPFDMLMLRVLYQAELRSGMSREEAAAVLPAVLERENPAGRGLRRQERHPESPAWAMANEAAVSRRLAPAERFGAARLATRLAAEMRPVDHRFGVSLLTLGRLTLRRDPIMAAQHFTEAYRFFRERLGPADLRTAHAGLHVATLALATGEAAGAVELAELYLPVARRGQNAVLVAGYLSVKSDALAALGRLDEAQAARLDFLQWARYGFGDADGALAREQVDLAARLETDGD